MMQEHKARAGWDRTGSGRSRAVKRQSRHERAAAGAAFDFARLPIYFRFSAAVPIAGFADSKEPAAAGPGTTTAPPKREEPKREAPKAEAPETGTTSLPDIEPKSVEPVASFYQVGSVASSFSYNGQIEDDTGGSCPISGGHPVAGHTGPLPAALKNIKVATKYGIFFVTGQIAQIVSYEICSGLGPELQTDIPSDSDPNITKANYASVASDLTPGADGRAPRNNFWASDITRTHELFHAHEWLGFAQHTGVPAAEQFLSVRGAKDMHDLNTALESVPGIADDATLKAMAPGAEARAYADGKPLYQARASSIKAKGDAGKYH